jgi:hypothetical protein
MNTFRIVSLVVFLATAIVLPPGPGRPPWWIQFSFASR